RFFLLIALGVIIVTSFQVWHIGMYDLHGSFIHSFFLASSMLTDNGLATQDYANWPTHTIVFLLLSSFFGGCIGSTCGGIKSLRFLILFKQSKHEINQLSHPRALLSVNVGGKIVTDRVMRSVWSFFFLYTLFTVFFILVLNGMGYDFLTSFATVAACINNMGLGFGATASSFGVLNDIAKYLMCIAMILGRLEIYPVIILFSGFFWRS
ncbi:TPA: Trk system potassium transporter TrkG, partial [Escherichia coli]